ncbi:hypothetical protein VRU32_004888 [Escherichia coli]|nr:hypothetical protein [Escherichia coli]EFT0847864.1 hypothetical protein [Escherichia coli]EMD6874497.1 hypothetical protein [Escherichia coli]
MRLRTLGIIFTAFACINSSYAGIARLKSSNAKISYIYNLDQVLWTEESNNSTINNGWVETVVDVANEVRSIGSVNGSFKSEVELNSTYPIYGHPDISEYPSANFITLNSTIGKGVEYSPSAGGTYWHYGVTNATINNSYLLGIQDSYHQNTNVWAGPKNTLKCLFPQQVQSDHSDVTVTYKIKQKFVETSSWFEINVIGECTAIYSGVATTLELSFPKPILEVETTTNSAEIETVLNTRIIDGIQGQAPKFSLTVDSPPSNVSVFIKKGEDYIILPTEISDPAQMERSDTIKIRLEDLATGKSVYSLRFVATIL